MFKSTLKRWAIKYVEITKESDLFDWLSLHLGCLLFVILLVMLTVVSFGTFPIMVLFFAAIKYNSTKIIEWLQK